MSQDTKDNKDLAQKEHWDSVYNKTISAKNWKPSSYEALCIENMLTDAINKYNPKSIIEVGCGNTHWLGYLQKLTGAKVSGIDYSEKGCELARNNLKKQGAQGEIHCVDFFKVDTNTIGQHDMLFSLGVVEHFEDLENVLSTLARFIKPGGIIVTEIPNLISMHGFLTWLWQPELYYKHKLIGKGKLSKSHTNFIYVSTFY